MSKRFVYYNAPTGGSYTGDFTDKMLALEGITLSAPTIAALAAWESTQTANGLINYSNPSSNKILAKWLLVHGVAGVHKYNFLDARDLDAAFRIEFNGGITHNAYGITGNGVNGFGKTFFTPSVNWADKNDVAVSWYCRTNNSGNQVDIGCQGAGAYYVEGIVRGFGATSAYIAMNDGEAAYTQARSDGYFMNRRTASNVLKADRNGVNVLTTATPSVNLPQYYIYLMAFNDTANGAGHFFSSRNYASFGIYKGISDAEMAADYVAEQAFQTALSRQV